MIVAEGYGGDGQQLFSGAPVGARYLLLPKDLLNKTYLENFVTGLA